MNEAQLQFFEKRLAHYEGTCTSCTNYKTGERVLCHVDHLRVAETRAAEDIRALIREVRELQAAQGQHDCWENRTVPHFMGAEYVCRICGKQAKPPEDTT